MPTSEINEQPVVSVFPRSSSNISASVPIKKRPVFWVRSPSPPPPAQLPSSPVGGCDVTDEKHGDLDQDLSPSNSVSQTASDTALTTKVSSEESGGVSMVKGSIDTSCTHVRDLPVVISQLDSEVASVAGSGTNNVTESNFENKCTLRTVLGSTKLIPALKEAKEQTYSMPIGEGKLVPSNTSAFRRVSSMEFQSTIKWPSGLSVDGPNSEATLPRQEKQDHFLSCLPSADGQHNHDDVNQDAGSNVESSHLCVDRANWDLNTMMDSWENTSSESMIKRKTFEQVDLKEGGITKDNLDLDCIQMHLGEPNGPDWKNDECLPQKRDPLLLLSNSSTTVSEHYSSEAFLNLQLKPSLVPDERLNLGGTYGEATSITGTPFASLSTEHTMPHIGASKLALCRSVKVEPHENCSDKDARKVEMSNFKQVKSEPVEGSLHEGPKTTSSGNFGSASSKIVKSKRLANLSPKSSKFGQHFGILTSFDTQVTRDMSTCVNKALGLISESIRANIQQEASEIVGNALSSVSKDPSHDTDEARNGGSMPVCAGISQDRIGTATEPSDMVLKPLLSEGKDLTVVKGACERAGFSARSLETEVSDDGKPPADIDSAEVPPRTAGLVGEIDHVSAVPSSDKLNVDSYENGGVAENSDMEISEDDMPVSSHDPLDAINSIKQVSSNYEDGEVRNFSCPDKLGRSCEGRRNIESTKSCSPVSMTVSVPLHPDEKSSRIEDADNLSKNPAISALDGDLSNNKNDPGISAPVNSSGHSDGVMSTSSDKMGHSNSAHKIPRDRLKKNEGPEKESRSNRAPVVRLSTEGRRGEGSGQAEMPHANHSVPSKDMSVIDHAKDMGRASHNQKDDKNSASEKSKSVSSRLTASSGIARERLADKSHRRERIHSQEGRDNSSNDKSRRFSNDRYQHQAAGKGGSDLQNIRRRGEFQYMSRLPLRRLSPGDRGQVPIDTAMLRHPMRNISPGRCIGRNIPDFVPSHEENLMRSLPDEMIDPRMLSGPVSPYERAEITHIRRGRRSLSPVQRRCPPSHMPRVCLESSPRSQQRLPPQWSPPRRSPDCFNGHPEVIRCRSPPIVRLDRMRSPHGLPCLPDDVLMRRHGSPSYMDRLPDRMDISPSREHMMDIGPPREHEFPRPVRVLERNMRRFDLMDPRDIAEEECFGPFFRDQAREIAGEQCIDDRRNFGGRHGLPRSVRQRLGPPDNGVENFHFHGDDPSRPSRFCPEPVDEFSERLRSRDLSGRIRNRLGNMTCRPRNIVEHEDNFMRHHEQGWRDIASNDMRPKRRRF